MPHPETLCPIDRLTKRDYTYWVGAGEYSLEWGGILQTDNMAKEEKDPQLEKRIEELEKLVKSLSIVAVNLDNRLEKLEHQHDPNKSQ